MANLEKKSNNSVEDIKSAYGNSSTCIKKRKFFMVMMRVFSFNPIQDGPFRDCSRMKGGQKGPPSLKSVTSIVQ